MKPTEILMEEHRLIERGLDVMQSAVAQMESGGKPPREFFDTLIEFARLFVEQFHHFKEEHLMFGRLAQLEKGAIDPQLDLLRSQHERGREHMNLIHNALDAYSEGDEKKAIAILENMAAYISLLKMHINMEEETFYPLCEKEFAEKDLDYLAELFRKEEDHFGADSFSRNEQIVAELEAMLDE